MNLPRLLAGIATALGALWVLSGEHLGGVSADATVNTRIATIRAPVDGTISLGDHSIGTSVKRGEPLGAVMPDRPAETPQSAARHPAKATGTPPAPPQPRLAAIANGIVWQVPQTSGAFVLRGDVLLRIADCDAALVTASVSKSTYNALSLGQNVIFRFDDTSETYHGSIARLAGTGAGAVYDDMAVAPSPEHLQRYDVAVLVPDLRRDERLRCLIGRTGRVFFEERPLDAVRAWFRQ